MRAFVRPAVIVTVLLPAAAAPAAPTYKNPTLGRDVALQIPGMHRARVIRNLVYRHNPEGPMKLDVYAPRGSSRSKPLPAVLFVHGGLRGVASPKDLGEYVGWGQLAAASGLIGVTFNHNVAWTKRDTLAAIAYVRSRARQLGIDADRLCVATHSAGAPDGIAAALEGYPPYIQCIVDYYGWLDAIHPEFSPLAFLVANPEEFPPMLVVKAGQDNPSINTSIDRFVAKARKLQARVRLITYKNGVHAFDTVLYTARSRAIIRATLDFLRGQLLAQT